MQKIFHFFLASGRKRRCMMAGVALWLLRLLRDIEEDEVQRSSDMLGACGWEVSRREYNALEDECCACEYALEFLESAIEDLESAY